MTQYQTNSKNFDINIANYIRGITIEKKVNKGKYNFGILVKNNGYIESHQFRYPALGDGIFIFTTNCSEEIEDILEKLTKSQPMIVYKK